MNTSPAKEKIRSLINSHPMNMIFFYQNVSTWAQVGLMETKNILEELVMLGELIEVKVPRFRGELFHELAVPKDQDFDWDNLQDPIDFMPLTADDIDTAYGYRRKK